MIVQDLENKALNIHKEVIDRCREGDRRAQYELYQLYHKAMLNTAFRIVGDADEAQDVLQEAFVSAFKNLKQYREDSAFGAWIKRIVINKAINHLKSRREFVTLEGENEEFYYDWEDVPDHNMTVDMVKNAITELPDGFRTVLTLYLFEGYDHKEIGQILNITESTSKSQYNRAKQKVRNILNKEVKYG